MADIEQRARFEAWAKPLGYPLHRRDFPGSERQGQYGNAYTEDAWQAWQAALASQAQVPDEPDHALLISMATRLNHGFGLLPADRQHAMLRDMRKVWDEVMGRGYYSPQCRERYASMLTAAPAPEVGSHG